MTHILGQKPFPRICRCCGCTEDNACVTDAGPCAWVLLDIETPTGICSACAEGLEWSQDAFASGWRPEILEAVKKWMGVAA